MTRFCTVMAVCMRECCMLFHAVHVCVCVCWGGGGHCLNQCWLRLCHISRKLLWYKNQINQFSLTNLHLDLLFLISFAFCPVAHELNLPWWTASQSPLHFNIKAIGFAAMPSMSIWVYTPTPALKAHSTNFSCKITPLIVLKHPHQNQSNTSINVKRTTLS